MSRHGDWIQVAPETSVAEIPGIVEGCLNLFLDQMERTRMALEIEQRQAKTIQGFKLSFNQGLDGNFDSCPKPFVAWTAEIG